MFFYLIIFILLVLFSYFVISLFPISFPRFQFDPSALWCMYGSPGSGKSTLAAWFAAKAMASGYTVYSNMPIIGTREFDKRDLGVWNIDNALVLWDEVGVDANSRNFKNNFTIDQIKWLKYHRHENCMVIIFSQGFDDMDKIIRTLTTAAFVVRKGIFKTITYKRIQKRPDIDEITHKPDDIYSFVPFSTKRIFAPAVWKHFDSFTRLGLPDREWNIFGAGSGDDEIVEDSAQFPLDGDITL